MRLKTKKMMAALGIILFTGVSAITTQAYTSCNFSTSNSEVTAYANGNINTAVFTYAGHCTENNYSKYAAARIWVSRAFYDKTYEDGKALTTAAFRKQKNAGKKDEEGIRIELKTYNTNGTSVTSSNSRIIRCN